MPSGTGVLVTSINRSNGAVLTITFDQNITNVGTGAGFTFPGAPALTNWVQGGAATVIATFAGTVDPAQAWSVGAGTDIVFSGGAVLQVPQSGVATTSYNHFASVQSSGGPNATWTYDNPRTAGPTDPAQYIINGVGATSLGAKTSEHFLGAYASTPTAGQVFTVGPTPDVDFSNGLGLEPGQTGVVS